MAADNVFGDPITEGATRDERATAALNNRNAGNKRNDCLAYVRKLKEEWGTGVSTLGIFYNATGESMVFTQQDSWYGKIVGPYPTRVQNGQWGAFFHTKRDSEATGSVAFVVYRVRMDDAQFCNMLIAWQTPWGQAFYNNQAYGDIFDDGKVDAPGDVYKKMDQLNSRQSVTLKKGMMVSSTIEQGTSPVYEAEFSRADALKSSVIKFAEQQHIVEVLSTVDQKDTEASSTADKKDVVEA